MSRPDAIAKIKALLDAMVTCHLCGGTLHLEDVDPTHCENCSSDCEEHELPRCTSVSRLHSEASRALRFLSGGAA